MAKYGDVFQQIQERLNSDLDDVVDAEERDRQERKHYLVKIYQQLERHLKELPGSNLVSFGVASLTFTIHLMLFYLCKSNQCP
jgi:hypothetical protein